MTILFLKQFIPGIEGVMNWWVDKIDSTGLPTKMEWWNFTDWAVEYQNGIPIGADDGYSSTIALQLVDALQKASVLFNELGNKYIADEYEKLSAEIQQKVVHTFYDSDRGLFAETASKDIFSQHTNILAILTNTVPDNQRGALMNKILAEEDLIQTTLYFKYYLFEALHKSGLGEKYTSLLQNWRNQLDLGLTTFAEKDIEPRSECHGWSASPNYHFLKIMAGIYPLTKNFKKIAIAPHFNGLESIEAEMPHPSGKNLS